MDAEPAFELAYGPALATPSSEHRPRSRLQLQYAFLPHPIQSASGALGTGDPVVRRIDLAAFFPDLGLN
jgi:hypothetical protein